MIIGQGHIANIGQDTAIIYSTKLSKTKILCSLIPALEKQQTRSKKKNQALARATPWSSNFRLLYVHLRGVKAAGRTPDIHLKRTHAKEAMLDYIRTLFLECRALHSSFICVFVFFSPFMCGTFTLSFTLHQVDYFTVHGLYSPTGGFWFCLVAWLSPMHFPNLFCLSVSRALSLPISLTPRLLPSDSPAFSLSFSNSLAISLALFLRLFPSDSPAPPGSLSNFLTLPRSL